MDQSYETHYFLGANASGGYISLFDDLINPESDNALHIIKGGPGCGKSCFISKIANAMISNGYHVEFFHCSHSPDTLDGIYIQELKTAYLDGTAPHGAVS